MFENTLIFQFKFTKLIFMKFYKKQYILHH